MDSKVLEARIIDGKKVASELREKLRHEVEELQSKGIRPGLAAVLVGEDPASQTYVRSKAKACEKIGLYSEVIKRPADISQDELAGIVRDLNARDDIDGILVQLPLPKHIDEMAITYLIDPQKDVDGFHPHNVGLMLIGKPGFRPCTPAGIIELLKYYKVETEGKEVVVLGRSNIVGKPVGVMLFQKGEMGNATVTFCHSRTKDLKEVCRRADILIVAIGRPEFVGADMVKDGAVIIDVGVNRVDDETAKKGYRLTGDVKFDECAEKASLITPVPKGVGPMTITMLLNNTVESARRKIKQSS